MYTVPATGGLFLDFGCSWIHGINSSTDGMLSSNPIWDIAVAAGTVTGSTGSAEDLVARGLQVRKAPSHNTRSSPWLKTF